MAMPRPFRSVARVLNPAIRPLARRLPPLALIHHTGRKSGRRYETPVMAFRADGGWVVALAYGSDVQWARNVELADRTELTRAGRLHRASGSRRLPARDGAPLLPGWARSVMGAVRVDEYILLTAEA
ncbi:deazaflavin-dependent oxidoreductase (nitroreductase family) [Lipingzhangella halophila]|uniref:Deazaflavin-dependent oxidoreductase (Nitroreductase family) n=1 Tax=Lipingzhangella halophila TaxID=1783352 RepID=A0A7W7RIK9_9ACTN|nr:nitroreductase family deazaflavin-dependent oxidoreductase [Lipingzhangella halophila]MBB4932572.1 deazaflavin-dependent oxidoreductase (nitroreductase family) [Lipingzhangella halophila]